ncbi:MAG TPA: PCRF domain-containing protein [Candidatus Pacearchaeota archaeon]|nr:PCRF domain-containing protein [Candidatus Pacearchaeota archaeon]
MENNPKAIIFEIRAGVGGDEAALFAADLFRMYSRYAQSKNWDVVMLSENKSDAGGIKEIIFEIKGDNAFEDLKHEAGVHRVQRIPKTEKSGRIHTSTATVAVLPKLDKTQINLNPNDVSIETTKASGPGGQYVNKRMNAVRATYLPTGLTVFCQTERNLQQNKEQALALLAAKIQEEQRRKSISEIEGKRREQIGSADRGEKIRTYNFPQDRITDHRINKKWHDIESFLEGKIDKMVKQLKQGLS